ncbi:MAG: BlaI/MecI/CopY family transcriptional regulator [Clostridium sp.]|nr:BlaI/MecI/CopY family transcriptional regulator [Clostridium sp.]
MSEFQKLTEKEEEVMRHYWRKGGMTVREVVDCYDEPRPHFNTVSTYVHILESKGYLKREKRGAALCYIPAISIDEYRRFTLKSVISKFFDDSYRNIISAFVKEEAVSVDELKEIVEMIENQKAK